MNVPTSPRVARCRGLSLLGLMVMVATLLALFLVLVAGARGWRRGTQRALCITNLRDVQLAVRSYQNMYGYQSGGRPYPAFGTRSIARHLDEMGYTESRDFLQAQDGCPCPGGGVYTIPFPEIFPEPGVLYMNCSHSHSHGHVPSGTGEW